MRIGVSYGQARWEYEIAADRLLSEVAAVVPALADPAAAVRAALEQPFGFPALRQALTPDDHVVVVVDETLPRLGIALAAVLDHVVAAGVRAESVTLLCAPLPGSQQAWLDELPDEFQDARLEVHNPDDRNKLSYLATMRGGMRLYLNRTLTDADQAVVVSSRRYDWLLGIGGAAGAIFPSLSDAETRDAMKDRLNLAAPDATPWPTRAEAMEAAWLLGAPFFVQIVEGSGDDWAHVVAGSVDSSVEAERLLSQRWRRTVAELADVVIAGIGGDPELHTFADLAAAAACAARVVKPDGRIVLLTEAKPDFGADAAFLASADEPSAALRRLRKEPKLAMQAALAWADAANRARIYLLSQWPGERVEELFATPLENAGQAQRLIDAGGTCVVLEDAHKSLAVIAE